MKGLALREGSGPEKTGRVGHRMKLAASAARMKLLRQGLKPEGRRRSCGSALLRESRGPRVFARGDAKNLGLLFFVVRLHVV